MFRLSNADYDERFDIHRFMAHREGMYDAFDSVFLAELPKLPRIGLYRIPQQGEAPRRVCARHIRQHSVLVDSAGIQQRGIRGRSDVGQDAGVSKQDGFGKVVLFLTGRK